MGADSCCYILYYLQCGCDKFVFCELIGFDISSGFSLDTLISVIVKYHMKKDFSVKFVGNNAAIAPGVDDELKDINPLVEGYMPADPGMAPPSFQEADVPEWIDLKRFQVFSTSGGKMIYANGYQQLKLMVLVQAVDEGQKVVGISESELDSIQLLDAYSGKALPIDSIRDGEEPAWKCTLERRLQYEPFPHTGELPDLVVRGKAIFRKEFYVSSNSPDPVKLIAAITRSDGEVFYSEETLEFGEISLRTVPPPIYRKEQFRVKHLSANWKSTENVAKVDRYVLDLLVDQHHIKFVDCSITGVMQARSEHPDYLGYYAVGYFNGLKSNDGAEVLWETADQIATYHDEQGKVTFLMHFATKGGASTVRYDELSVKMFVRDMYGNRHEVDVEMNPQKPSMIEVV
ncbi:hypothetical protein J3D47_000305 [Pseudomonas laurylsulfativorans]|uniref:hypothetical protein n=1 Tax=Pseudomonas laurylsulfativorans TaxID=1943631 RepID=UPI0020A0074C|nr:hypothetical protein [Pseudomonas laurylsulfativorans]MCP1416062.1 hypothetical protein [Pseudomonas laurylsulfativorans]